MPGKQIEVKIEPGRTDQKEVNMQCNRCNGLRVLEMVQDGGLRALVYRCILCGDLVDQKILLHRRSRDRSRMSRPRTPVHGSERWKRNRMALS